MNISRLDSVGIPAGHIHRTEKQGVRTPTETTAAMPATLPDNELSPRLAQFAHKVDQRIADAVGSMKLSPRQQEALEDTQDKFHSMMQRLDAAFGSEEGIQGKASAALGNILDLMAESVSSIIHQGKDARPTAQREEFGTDFARSARLRAETAPKIHASKIDKLA